MPDELNGMPNTTSLLQQFLSSVKRGTGEAYLLQKANPSVDFSDFIIKGSTVNYAYDAQCEGSRAVYMYGLIKKAKQKARIIKAILNKLQIEKTDYYGIEQMCDLAVLFYKDGLVNAKQALYNRFEKNGLKGYEFCGQDQIIAVDGLQGLFKVADAVGKKILEENDWEDSYRVDAFQKKNKKLTVYTALEQAGKSNKFIDAYYKSIIENKRALPKKRSPIDFSYEEIRKQIDKNELRAIFIHKANEFSPADTQRLASDFLIETAQNKQELYLRFFARRKFPFDYLPILKIASKTNPEKTRLVYNAVEALAFFSAGEIRQLVLDKLSALANNPYDYLPLFVNNYQSGDDKLLLNLMERSDDEDYVHAVGSGIIDIYKANSTPECKEPLELIYQTMNCSIHREDIVKLLVKNQVLSETVFPELQFDNSDAIRKIYREIKKERS